VFVPSIRALRYEASTVTLTGHTGWICAVAWSPDGARLATADDGGMIILWTRHGRELTSVNIQEARSLAWSMDKIAVGRWSRPAIIKVIGTEDAIT
jgi:WD40 repeat protein